MQVFFLNGLWRFLKNGYLPVKLHASAPSPRGLTANSPADLKPEKVNEVNRAKVSICHIDNSKDVIVLKMALSTIERLD